MPPPDRWHETSLYPPVKAFLEAQAFVVKGEICGCDVVGVRKGEPPILVIAELKRSFTLDLVLQAVDRLRSADSLYFAVVASRRGRDRDPRVVRLCRLLGVGLLAVDMRFGTVALLCDAFAYQQHDAIHLAETREAARVDLIDRWDRQRQAEPDSSRIILTHTNDEVALLNLAARKRLRAREELGDDVALQVEKGERHFAAGDRVMFGRNERGLGVKNGSLGRIESVTATRMAVMLDNGTAVSFDFKDYAAVDHGYAATIHKA